jgi:predicted nucleic acid-binding protein
MLIAALAITAKAVLVTRDGIFSRIEGLRGVENWATDL